MMRDLYWGDNLDILRHSIASESVDLIYLDPPFNSSRNYNVLFREPSHVESQAQIEAFTDTWQWSHEAEATYDELVGGYGVPAKVSVLIEAMRSFIGSNDVMAYLVMMTIRLLELHRVLKPTGSIYLHCDPTASHYLKVVMDTIWGPKNFRSEIVWQRSTAKGHAFTRFPDAHDVLLYYWKSDRGCWNPQYLPHREELIKSHYNHVEPETGRRYTLGDCLNPNPNRPNLTYEWNGQVRVWRWTKDRMQRLHDEGRLVYTRSGTPRYKRYLDEMPGTPLTTVWTDIPPINSQAVERLGYPTQKPEALLERIIRSSSNPGDVVLDPFCGCGTAVAVAERLDRQWIGIDITHLAIAAIVSRMTQHFPDIEIERHGEPRDVSGAEALAQQDRYDFQNWALAFVGARPIAEDARGKSKKGADRGIDGLISFLGDRQEKPGRCLIQVKSGHVSSATIGELRGTIEREKAEMGLLVTLEEPTGPMRREALTAGFYRSELMQRDYPRIQILTVAELFNGTRPQMPPPYNVHQLAERRQREAETEQQRSLFDRLG